MRHIIYLITTLCCLALVSCGKQSAAVSPDEMASRAAKVYYEEKHDKTSFVKSILSDNILLSDIYVRAKELHVEAELTRGVFVM